MLAIREQSLDTQFCQLISHLSQSLGCRLSDRYPIRPRQPRIPSHEEDWELTIFRNVRERRIHIRESEDVGEERCDGDSEVVHPDPPLSRCSSVEDRALEMGIDFLVQLALVLDTSRDGLVSVDDTEFEVSCVAL